MPSCAWCGKDAAGYESWELGIPAGHYMGGPQTLYVCSNKHLDLLSTKWAVKWGRWAVLEFIHA